MKFLKKIPLKLFTIKMFYDIIIIGRKKGFSGKGLENWDKVGKDLTRRVKLGVKDFAKNKKTCFYQTKIGKIKNILVRRTKNDQQ